MKDLRYRDKDWLYNQYIILRRPTSQIAKLCNCCKDTICDWLKRLKIPIRSPSEAKRGELNPMYGKHHSKEHKKKISEGEKGKITSEITKRKMSIARKKYLSHEENRIILSNTKKGELNPAWKGGISSERQRFHSSREWKKAWRIVYKRDKGICQYCKRETFISFNSKDSLFPNVHHIIGFKYKDIKLVLSNLILVCRECHLWIHSKMNKKNKFILKPTKENIRKMIQTQRTGTLLEYIYCLEGVE